MNQEHDPLLGTVVHEFRIVKRLGIGGMGQVHLAQHVYLDQLRVVIKTVLKEHIGNEQLRARFFAEAAAVSRLHHHNIIKITNFGTLPSGELFFIMPYLEGRPLDDVLRGAAKLGPHHVLQLAAQIGSALQHAHARNIIHRDLKPGNIFLTRDGNRDVVQLLDFGIAKDANATCATPSGARTHTGAAMGTPQYMPCEAYIDAATVGPTADVFSLAVMIVEMLTGQLPWGFHPGVVLYNKQKDEPPTFTEDVPRAWVPVLRAALAPDPSQRPPSARTFIIALANALPPLPPIWKSGAEIVKDVATDLITDAAPHEETVRAANNTPLTAIPVYPALASAPPAPHPVSTGQDAMPPPAHAAPSMPATVNARPAIAGSPPTTLSASNGVSQPPAPPVASPRRGQLVLIGLGTVGLAAGLIAFVARIHTGNRSVASQPAPVIINGGPGSAAVMIDAAPMAVANDAAPMNVATDAAIVAVPAVADAAVSVKAPTPARRVTSSSRLKSPRETASKKPETTQPATGTAERPFDPNAPAGEN
jgi:serine/threonine-protein kinase